MHPIFNCGIQEICCRYNSRRRGPECEHLLLEKALITINEAFQKFRSKLELTQKEQDDASRRQKEIREFLDDNFKLQTDFLSGSYRRFTKTKPLKDVDIFCVLHDDERSYRQKHPSAVLRAVGDRLAREYGKDKVVVQRRSVSISFDVSGEEDRVMSFDVVPAFTKGGHYEIPDTAISTGWTETNPEIHAEKATNANRAFGGEWKGMVRMFKKWNLERGKPVKPSFLLEVMALDLLRPPFGGDYAREFKSLFASAADRIYEDWPDPAGLGPPVSDSMTTADRQNAARLLLEASNLVTDAIRLARDAKNEQALRTYKGIFGDLLPLS